MPSSSGPTRSSVPRSANRTRRRPHRVARVALAHRHLVGRWSLPVEIIVSVSPTVQKDSNPMPNSPWRLAPVPSAFSRPLDRIANVRRDVLEIWPPLLVAGHALAVVPDRKVMLSVLTAARDRDGRSLRVDTVLDELSDRLQGICSARSAMMRIAFQSSPILSLRGRRPLLFRGTFDLGRVRAYCRDRRTQMDPFRSRW